ncbi:mitochondrial carrier protein [Ceratobasidium sp. AG-Ba]|nr:mitochondrial carrier protein [Ceratobasidium sp. AG-Ba]
MNIFAPIVFVLAMIGPIALGLAISVPIAGAIVRLRANYTPKGLQLNQEEDINGSSHVAPEARVGPTVNGIINMLRRIHRLEGVPGLYKGFMPAFVSTILLTLWAVLTIPGHAKYRPRSQVHIPATGILRGLLYGMGALAVSIPYEILFNRSVCTPHRLPWFRPMEAVRIILTPYERRKPWVLYLTPGLLAARLLILFWVVAVARVVRAMLLPSLADGLGSARDEEDQNRMTKFLNPTNLTIFTLFSASSTAILCPLEVLATRLSVQRNHPQTDADCAIDGMADPVADYIGEEEDVIALRSEEDPYIGLSDCARRMIDEEGFGSLFRAWWLTMLAVTLGGFA